MGNSFWWIERWDTNSICSWTERIDERHGILLLILNFHVFHHLLKIRWESTERWLELFTKILKTNWSVFFIRKCGFDSFMGITRGQLLLLPGLEIHHLVHRNRVSLFLGSGSQSFEMISITFDSCPELNCIFEQIGVLACHKLSFNLSINFILAIYDRPVISEFVIMCCERFKQSTCFLSTEIRCQSLIKLAIYMDYQSFLC